MLPKQCLMVFLGVSGRETLCVPGRDAGSEGGGGLSVARHDPEMTGARHAWPVIAPGSAGRRPPGARPAA